MLKISVSVTLFGGHRTSGVAASRAAVSRAAASRAAVSRAAASRAAANVCSVCFSDNLKSRRLMTKILHPVIR